MRVATPKDIGLVYDASDKGASQRLNTGEPAWAQFEQQVKHGLECLGYAVTRNTLRAGSQIDLFAEQRNKLFTHRLVVECKDIEAPVGVAEARGLAGLTESLSTKEEPIHGLLVSRTGFTKECRAFAKTSGVWALTVDELLGMTFDPRRVIEPITKMFENDELGSRYVHLSCQVAEHTAGTIYKPVESFLSQFYSATHTIYRR